MGVAWNGLCGPTNSWSWNSWFPMDQIGKPLGRHAGYTSLWRRFMQPSLGLRIYGEKKKGTLAGFSPATIDNASLKNTWDLFSPFLQTSVLFRFFPQVFPALVLCFFRGTRKGEQTRVETAQSSGFHLWQHFQIWSQWFRSNRFHLLGNFDFLQELNLFKSILLGNFCWSFTLAFLKPQNSNKKTMLASPQLMALATPSGWAAFDGRISFSEWLGTWLLVRYCWWLKVEIWGFFVEKIYHLLDVFCFNKKIQM